MPVVPPEYWNRAVSSGVTSHIGPWGVLVFLEQVLHPDIALIQCIDMMPFLLLLQQGEQQARKGRQRLFDIGDDDLLELGPFADCLQDIV